jgi:mannan endo-1,4-beta-mannosidase
MVSSCLFISIGLLNKRAVSEAAFPTPGNLAVAEDSQPKETANPNANENCRKILSYLKSLSTKPVNRVLLGQYMGNSSGQIESRYEACVENLYKQTGLWLPLVGNGYMGNTSVINKRLTSYWNQGGIVLVFFHPKNPWTGEGPTSYIPTAANLRDLVNPAKSVHSTWIDELDRVASGLAELQANNVSVLFFPLDEVNQLDFWWGKGTGGGENATPSDFKVLWKHMFEYFTFTKKLNNLLWVYGPNAYVGDTANKRGHWHDYYPGSNYVDIVGVSAYGDDIAAQKVSSKTGNPYKLWAVYEDMTKGLSGHTWSEYDDITALGKPFGITGYGPGPPTNQGTAEAPPDPGYDYRILIDRIRNKFPKVTFVLAWSGPSSTNKYWAYIYHRHYKELLNDPWVITRDELSWPR